MSVDGNKQERYCELSKVALSSYGDPSERMNPELVIPLGEVVRVKGDEENEMTG